MKKAALFLFFLVLPASVFGQQTLWSTAQTNDVRYVPLNDVLNETLSFYDQYNYYYDYAGFTKDRFIQKFPMGFDDWKWLYDIKDLTVFALRSNMGHGSVVIVMCVNKNNVHAIIFSNNGGRDCISTNEYYRKKFASWFKTLLN